MYLRADQEGELVGGLDTVKVRDHLTDKKGRRSPMKAEALSGRPDTQTEGSRFGQTRDTFADGDQTDAISVFSH